MKNLIRGAFFCLLVTALAACASENTRTIYTKVSDATLKAGDTIPTPTGDVILTVTGKIGAANNGDAIEMDLPMIEAAGLVDYKVKDPFENTDATFRGPLMSSLLDLWKVPQDATTLHMVALNDYSVDVPIAEVRKYPVVFALKQDGEYMPVASRGPAMLVFPYNDFEFNQALYNDYWIWQIKSIDVQ
jgi:hypothetical protein